MNTYKDFSHEILTFFSDYLIKEKGCSEHTIRAYRDTISALVDFMESQRGIHPDNIKFENLDKDCIVSFLNWLQDSHKNSSRTRNQRYAVIRSFFKYMMYEDPVHMEQWKQVCSIPMKREQKGTLNYLSVDAVKTILEQVNPATPSGLRNLTMLSLLYNTGARVQELIDLSPFSIRQEKPYYIEVLGKGAKKRIIPLDEEMIQLLQKYIDRFGLNRPGRETHPLFFNAWGGKLTNPGVSYVINKYADLARKINPEIIPEKLSPHVFRHSRAMHLLQAGVPLIYIRDILGHISIQTTEIYARADSKQKREALEKAYESIGIKEPKIKKWEKDVKLKQMLKDICK